MFRKVFCFVAVSVFCLLGIHSDAEDKPEKRIMNFLAVMDFNCGTYLDKAQCNALTELVIGEFSQSKKYTVVDRANRDKILSEAGFQLTGCVDESCTIEAARILGVGKVVIGSVTQLGSTYLINLQLINVETAAVEKFAKETCKDCKLDDLIASMTKAAKSLIGEEEVKVDADPSNKNSTIYVFRPKRTTNSFDLSLDKKPIGTYAPCSCVKIKIEQGTHLLSATGKPYNGP